MNQTNHTTKSRKNKYLTEKERYKIEALLKIGLSKIKIAQEIGKSDRTIRREVWIYVNTLDKNLGFF